MTLSVQDSTLSYVVRSLVHQAHLQLWYDVDSPQFTKRITVRVDQMNLMDALAVVLKGTGLTARLAAGGETVLRPSAFGELIVAGTRQAAGEPLVAV